MNNIEWKDGAVCYSRGSQWFASDEDKFKYYPLCNKPNLGYGDYEHTFTVGDFKLNEIREGDFIPASELDSEQKYNEVVEVFWLFGFDTLKNKNYFDVKGCEVFKTFNEFVVPDCLLTADCKRQLTYSQIIAIGKLKRMMLEREKYAPKTATDLTADKPKSAVDYLKECVEVQKQRGEQYDSTGTGERSFDAAAKAYNALTGGELKGSDVCLILTCVKAVRQYSNPERLHEDSLLDF